MKRSRATELIRISKEAKAQIEEHAHRTGLTTAKLIDHFMGIPSDTPTPSSLPTPEAAPATTRRRTPNLPPQGLADAFIMDVWGISKLRLNPELRIDQIPLNLEPYEWDAEAKKRTLALQAELKELQRPISRKEILKHTFDALIDAGWGTIYPGWFKALKDNHGEFQTMIDKRLTQLVRHTYLTRNNRGIYNQNDLLMREIDAIAGAVVLIPQNNLKITRLLSRKLLSQVDTYREYQNRHQKA